jgi:hypothetical protein
MNFRAHIRHTATSSDKIAFSDSLRHQRDASFAHCEARIRPGKFCSMHVSAGDSHEILWEHIAVLTPGVTDSFSCPPPYYRATSRHCACSKVSGSLWGCFHVTQRFKNFNKIFVQTGSLGDFWTLQGISVKNRKFKIWRSEVVTQYTVKGNASTSLSLVQSLPFCWLNFFISFFVLEKIRIQVIGRSFVPGSILLGGSRFWFWPLFGI